MDYQSGRRDRRRRNHEFNSPVEVAARQARVQEERELAEHHRRQDDKVREFLSDLP
jgi:hypothetical protein